MAKNYVFTESDYQRTRAAVRAVEGPGGFDASRQTNGGPGAIIIDAKLTSRDGTDKTLYAWSQARRKTDGDYETVTSGLSGTADKVPAIDRGNHGDLSNTYAVLARGVWKDADGKIAPCWYVVATQQAVAIVVLLNSDGGTIGTQTSASSWTYAVTDVASNPIITGASPSVGWRNGALAAASFGIGYYPPDGSDFVLVVAFETSGTDVCPSE